MALHIHIFNETGLFSVCFREKSILFHVKWYVVVTCVTAGRDGFSAYYASI